MGLSGGKSGGKNALASKPNLLNALRVQTSSYGQVVPIVYGQNRISGRLLWSGDFTSIPHTSTQKVGGKGLGSGGGNVSQTTYTYQTAVAIALCMGPIQNMYNVWDTKGRLTLVSSSVQYTVPGGGGSFGVIPPSGGIFHSPHGVSRADAYNFQANDFGSDGSATLAGTQQTPMLLVSGTPGGGQYSLSGSSFTFSAADAGKTMTINYVYSVPDSNSNGQPQQKLNLTLFLGSRPQSPWSYLTSRHPGQDLGYNGIAYIASSALDLGDSGALPNLSYEVLGILPFGGGITDAEPSAIVNDLLSNPYYGLAGVVPLDANTVFNNASSFKNFCIANGLFVSPMLDAQKSAAAWIQALLDITNSAAVWSEGVLKIIPYGDTTAVGNGAIFTPNTAPVYDLSSNDFLDVVTVKRPSIADVMNSVSVEFANRANDYNPEIAEDKDEAIIGIYGLRKAQPLEAHSITTTSVAKQVANFLRKRQVEIRATYTLKLGWQFNLLEPMDLVTLTIPELGYSKKPVRITAIREDSTGQLEIDAEDFPWATATATLYPQQQPTAFVPNINADPGSVNAPVVFEAPFQLSHSGSHEIWMAVSGSSSTWGGCSVWLSQDNTEYHQIGKIYAPARMGAISASVAAGSDPDTTNFFPVDLSESSAILSSGTQADADSYRTLCFADGEFIAYRDVNLTGSSNYNVGQNSGGAVYVRRGLFGTQNVAHNAGTPFVRLDDAIFTYVYDPAFIGKTIYLKFTSFNTNGMVEQSIANPNVAAYQFVVLGTFCMMDSASKNLIANPGFESNQALAPFYPFQIPSGQRLADDWSAAGDLTSFSISLLANNTPRTGTNCCYIHLNNGVTIPANSVTSAYALSDKVPIAPGESYSFGGYIYTSASASLPAGLSLEICYSMFFYDAGGVLLMGTNPFGIVCVITPFVTSNQQNSYSRFSGYYTIAPTLAGRVPAFARLACAMVLSNNTGSPVSTSVAGGFPCDVRFDDVWLFPQWSPTNDEIGKQGSMSNTYVGGLTYTNNASSITWSWSINAQRTDSALSVNSYSGSQAVTGLAAATSYNFYPFIDEINQVVSMVATGGVGSPSWAHSGTSVAWAAEQDRGDHYPLSTQPVPAATTSSGTGSGGSGGGIGGVCLRSDARVRERTKGVIPVCELEAGDFVSCPADHDTPDGWAEVIAMDKSFTGNEWVHTFFNVDEWLATTPGHPFTLHDGSRKLAAQLCFEDAVPCATGITFPREHSLHRYQHSKVSVTVRSRRHLFYAGMKDPVILQHNFIPQS